MSLDPLAAKYVSWSDYVGVLDNPVTVIDPDGRDVIVLRNSGGAKGLGHGAVLIGSEKNGWTYVSKDGYSGNPFVKTKSKYVVKKFGSLEEFRNSPHNFETENTHSTANGTEAESFDYKLDENGNKIQRYDKAMYFNTTQADGTSTDAAALDAAIGSAKSDYCLTNGDCSDVITETVNNSKTSNGKPITNGENPCMSNLILDGFSEIPNVKYNRIESRNDQDVNYDDEIKSDK